MVLGGATCWEECVLLTFYDLQSFFDRRQFLADQTKVVWLISRVRN
jgi:hypothetical protein